MVLGVTGSVQSALTWKQNVASKLAQHNLSHHCKWPGKEGYTCAIFSYDITLLLQIAMKKFLQRNSTQTAPYVTQCAPQH